MFKEITWTPTWNTCWSMSHIWTKYSNNLSWALMPWILKKFNKPHCRREFMVPRSFKAIASSSSCSLYLHSNIFSIKIPAWRWKKEVSTFNHHFLELFLVQRIILFLGFRSPQLGFSHRVGFPYVNHWVPTKILDFHRPRYRAPTAAPTHAYGPKQSPKKSSFNRLKWILNHWKGRRRGTHHFHANHSLNDRLCSPKSTAEIWGEKGALRQVFDQIQMK